jgi:hypothetical protein
MVFVKLAISISCENNLTREIQETSDYAVDMYF